MCRTMKRPRKGRRVDEERSSSWWRNGYRNWDDTAFRKRLRTNRATFQFILGEIEDQLVKEPTRFKPEPPDTQLAICLYRLAHACTYSTVETCSVLPNQPRVSFLTKYVRYWFQIFMTDLFTYQETEPNDSMNLKASLRTGNFHALEPGMDFMFMSARS